MVKRGIVALAVLLPGLAGAVTVDPAQIAGVKRVTPEYLELAWSGPRKLFTDDTAVAVKTGNWKLAAETQVIADFKALRPGVSFTCAVKAVSGSGPVKLTVSDNTGKVIASVTVKVNAGQWSKAAFSAGEVKAASGEYRIAAAGNPGIELGAVSLYRSFEQSFEQGTKAPLEGVSFHKFGSSEAVSPNLTPGSNFDGSKKCWNTAAAGVFEGVDIGEMDKNFLPLAGVSKKSDGGIKLEVPTRNGCYVNYMLFNTLTLSLQKENSGHRNCYAGKKDKWSQGSFDLVVDDVDNNKDAIWRGGAGQSWASSSTLLLNYGSGKIAYIAFLNQNRIDLPEDAKNFSFEYRGATDPAVRFQTPVPDKARSVALVKRGDGGTQLVWNINGVWTGGSVIRDSADPDCLMVRNNSITIE